MHFLMAELPSHGRCFFNLILGEVRRLAIYWVATWEMMVCLTGTGTAMEIQTKDSLMLSRNKDKFHAELQAAEVPVQQFHYNHKGADDVHRAGHVLESRALLVIVAALVGYKKYSAKTKTTGLLLLAELVRQAASLPVAQAEQLRISFNMQVPSTVIFFA